MFLALTETKRKGSRESLWCEVSGICAVIQENERTRESVTVLLNDESQL